MGLLIKGFDNYVFDALEDKIMLMAINVENACEQLGLEPGVDYSKLDIVKMAVQLVPSFINDKTTYLVETPEVYERRVNRNRREKYGVQGDLWFDPISDWIDMREKSSAESRLSLQVEQIFYGALGFDSKEKMTLGYKKRIEDVLSHLGFNRVRDSVSHQYLWVKE